METQTSYYAVIPANVRYDKKICSSAKLLYGEITSLCNKEGYCWANNEYFETLYVKSERCIRNWIKQLVNAGYINSEVERGKKTVRKIYLTGNSQIKSSANKKNSVVPEKNCPQGGKKLPPLPIYNIKKEYKNPNSAFKKEKFYYKWGQKKLEMRKYQNKWWVVPNDGGDWLEFNDREEKIIKEFV